MTIGTLKSGVGALILGVLFSGTVLAQGGNPVSNAILAQRAGDLDRAKVNIDQAAKREDEQNKPKFWYTRGSIYFDLANSQDPKFKALAGDSGALVAFASFTKAMKLEETEKSKEYTDLVKKSRPQLYVLIFNSGADAFSKEKFAVAYNLFIKAAELKKNDTMAYNNAMSCAYRMGDPVAAENVIKLEEQSSGKTAKFSSYLNVAQLLQEKNDQGALLSFIAKARQKFPKEPSLIRVELKSLVDAEKYDEAKPKVQELIEAEPNNASWVYFMGSLYNNESRNADKANKHLEAFTAKMKALDYYKQASKMDPQNASYSYDAGAIIFNRAKALLDSADDIQNKDLKLRNKNPKLAPNPKIKQYITKAEGFFKESKDYFENTIRVDPKDDGAIRALLQVYGRLKDQENFKRIEKLSNEADKK